ncbi:hypothetical protein BU23DRAFT_575651 [Bimuria novae-zelandiae CBS 107.79]|uniref:F-box domain-containing protein n=1 Tax=Bimuria novae-zelandiae CBS 107.79 TaxID=1447943 RepID=A0A6A5UH04_9PLEO|nr:hypothetical protein BU23DRAFT_575651 [Bimuria novae-zelandiae CBS 107.79]
MPLTRASEFDQANVSNSSKLNEANMSILTLITTGAVLLPSQAVFQTAWFFRLFTVPVPIGRPGRVQRRPGPRGWFSLLPPELIHKIFALCDEPVHIEGPWTAATLHGPGKLFFDLAKGSLLGLTLVSHSVRDAYHDFLAAFPISATLRVEGCPPIPVNSLIPPFLRKRVAHVLIIDEFAREQARELYPDGPWYELMTLFSWFTQGVRESDGTLVFPDILSARFLICGFEEYCNGYGCPTWDDLTFSFDNRT